MIRSMTGFGRGEARSGKGKVTVEIKTVNHKFFDATTKLPANMLPFEDRLKEVLQKKIGRGKVYLNMIYDGVITKDEKIIINEKIARRYYNELLSLNKSLGLQGGIATKDLMDLPGVLNYEAREEDLARFWPTIKKALDSAINKLIVDREREGRLLCIDLAKRSRKIDSGLTIIKARAHLNINEYRRRFAARIKDLAGGREIDMGRLEMEVAIFAKNSDISEEITRLKNHLSNFNKTISGTGEVGKKLDFIAQELHREINTIGSKASDFKISKSVIEVKGEVEKIREQAKNLE